MAVKNPRFIQQHDILISAKIGKTLVNKMIKNRQCLLAGDGKTKIIKIAKMVSASSRHKTKHIAGHVIWRKLKRRRDHHTRFG